MGELPGAARSGPLAIREQRGTMPAFRRSSRASVWLVAALIVTLSFPSAISAQEVPVATLTGYVRSESSAEVIRTAHVLAVEVGVRVLSNRFGFFAIELPHGTHTLRVSALGYEVTDLTVTVDGNKVQDVLLPVRAIAVEGIAVTAAKDRDIDPESIEMSVARLTSATLTRTPVVLGEADPLKTITLLPGVVGSNEGSSSFNVRGGGGDQNLILLDDAVVYNPSHLFGFFSVFNTDAIDDATLYKGGIPARYGGRLSSVLEIQQREGDAEKLKGRASIGLLSSRLLAEGPLFGDRGSFLLAGRRSYADLFLGLSSDETVKSSVAYFYDLNAKGSIRVGATGQILLSGYVGRDRFRWGKDFSNDWGNQLVVARWRQGVGTRLFANAAFVYSDYDYSLDNLASGATSTWEASIRNMTLKLDNSLYLNNRNTLEFGFDLAQLNLSPGRVSPTENSGIQGLALSARKAESAEIYLEHESDLGSVAVRYGLRGSLFRRRGADRVLLYSDDAPVVYNQALRRHERGEVVDSLVYGDGETIRSFRGLEPRVSVRLDAGAGAIKASYNRTRQNLFLVSNTNSPTPLNVWEPVGTYFKPQFADQWVLGYSREARAGQYAFSVESYYKLIHNTVDFIAGADLMVNDRLETEVLPGEGRAYGIEFFARRTQGPLTGWASYTLSRAEQRVSGISLGDPGINNGEYYPSAYDRTHNFTITGEYGLSETWSLASVFAFSTGLPATLPAARYEYAGLLLAEYGERNTARLPAYHRLDISAVKRFGRGELQFGVYNAYNRFNASSLSYRQKEGTPLTGEAVQTSIFGIVPSISYSFRF